MNAGIVVTGGGAMIPNLKNFVEQYTGYHAQIGLPISRLANLQDKSYAQTIYATSIGLALLAADNSEDYINESLEKKDVIPETIVIEPPHFEKPIETKQKNLSWLDKIQNKIGNFLLDESTLKEFEDK